MVTKQERGWDWHVKFVLLIRYFSFSLILKHFISYLNILVYVNAFSDHIFLSGPIAFLYDLQIHIAISSYLHLCHEIE